MVNHTDLGELKLFKKGKVRDVYQLDDNLLIVATDRISCFDVVLDTPIPDKGKILTRISLFWFSFLKDIVANHLISSDFNDLPSNLSKYKDILADRFMIVKKSDVIPFECVVRGYLSGSGWKEYSKSGTVCGLKLPKGLGESQKLEKPLFTPSTKAEIGHDENVSFQYMKDKVGSRLAEKVKSISLDIYKKAVDYAQGKGVIIADTKFEFGIYNGQVILVDEVLTPDSSRFWPKDDFAVGRAQVSFDKQFVRDYLESTDWNKQPPAPKLPADIVDKTKQKYEEISEKFRNL